MNQTKDLERIAALTCNAKRADAYQVGTDEERERFEAFALNILGDHRFQRDHSGQYVQPLVHHIWWGWRMRVAYDKFLAEENESA